MDGRNRKRLFILIFWAAWAFALIMALLPQPPQVMGDANDKIQHIVAFAALSVLAVLAYPGLGLLRIGLFLSFYGAAIEVLQAIPVLHRDSDFWDWVADTGAVIVALALVQVYLVLRRT